MENDYEALIEEAIKSSGVTRGILHNEIRTMLNISIKELILRKNAELNRLCTLISIDKRIQLKFSIENIFDEKWKHEISETTRDICVLCGIYAIPYFSELDKEFKEIRYALTTIEFVTAFFNYVNRVSDYIDADLHAYYLEG